jgi:hypothetical protein
MRTTLRLPGLVALVAIGLMACGTGALPADRATASPSARVPAPSDATPSSLPPVVPSEPTPFPSAPVPGAAAAAGAIVFALHWTDDVVEAATATVVRDDGLVVWRDEEGAHQLRVGPEGIAWMREQLDATGLLDKPASYDATLRPGAEPPGRGVTGYGFVIPRDGGIIRVGTGSPGDYDPAFWIVPPEMVVLGTLAAQIRDADSWILPELVTEPAQPYSPAEYLLHVTLRRGPEGPPSQDTDVSEVAWPFAGGLEGVGTVVPDEERGQTKRCAVITRATAEAMVAAELAAGVEYPHDLQALSQQPTLRWAAGKHGTASIALQQLLPDQHDCVAFAG